MNRLESDGNPKHEARNPKQIRMTETEKGSKQATEGR